MAADVTLDVVVVDGHGPVVGSAPVPPLAPFLNVTEIKTKDFLID